MPLRTKRWNDPPEAADGFRLLVCRLRPRGVAKATQPWDDWWPELGPSRALLDAFHGKSSPATGPRPKRAVRGATGTAKTPGLPWEDYARRYLDEMRGSAQIWRIRALAARVAAGETVTLLCSSACTDPAHCHRTLLARLIAPEANGRDRATREDQPARRPGRRASRDDEAPR